jgi:hypothetical protein
MSHLSNALAMEIRRRLYRRGSSRETTIPKPLLFALDDAKQYDVVFAYDPRTRSWGIRIEERASRRKK